MSTCLIMVVISIFKNLKTIAEALQANKSSLLLLFRVFSCSWLMINHLTMASTYAKYLPGSSSDVRSSQGIPLRPWRNFSVPSTGNDSLWCDQHPACGGRTQRRLNEKRGRKQPSQATISKMTEWWRKHKTTKCTERWRKKRQVNGNSHKNWTKQVNKRIWLTPGECCDPH